MTENKEAEQVNQEAEQQTNADRETGEKGKTFTQDEVSKIVAERLKRAKTIAEKEHAQAMAVLQSELGQGFGEKEAELTKRERIISCREYCLDNGYPVSLLDVINTDNVEEFKKKADIVRELAKARQSVPPLKSTENHNGFDDLKKAFADPKHVPKPY